MAQDTACHSGEGVHLPSAALCVASTAATCTSVTRIAAPVTERGRLPQRTVLPWSSSGRMEGSASLINLLGPRRTGIEKVGCSDYSLHSNITTKSVQMSNDSEPSIEHC